MRTNNNCCHSKYISRASIVSIHDWSKHTHLCGISLTLNHIIVYYLALTFIIYFQLIINPYYKLYLEDIQIFKNEWQLKKTYPDLGCTCTTGVSPPFLWSGVTGLVKRSSTPLTLSIG